MVSFNQIPAGLRTPFIYSEFDPSNATQGPVVQDYTALHVGQRLTAGATQPELVPKLVTSADQAARYWGQGSQLHLMAIAWFANNRTVDLWQIAQLDDGAGIAATATLTASGTATAAGTVYLYINGKRIAVAVASGDTAATVAASIDAAVTAEGDLPVTSGVASAVVTLTAKNKGEFGNALDARFNYQEGEEFPTGITVTPTTFGSGANNADVTDVWPVIEPTQYHVMVFANNDTNTMAAVKAEMEARADALRGQEGLAFVGARKTLANAAAFGLAQNSAYVTVMAMPSAHEAEMQLAAAYGGQVAGAAQTDPGRPFKTLPLVGVTAPATSALWTRAERQTLLESGVSTFIVDAGGIVRIERGISTFTVNALGAADTSFLSINTALILSYLRFSVRARFTQRYPRHKLGQNSKRYGVGQAIVTPNRIRGEFLNLFGDWEELALVEDREQFTRDLVVQINSQDPNRVDAILPPNLINGFEILASSIKFIV